MILPDVNVLVYAFRREADRHERYAQWLAGVVAGDDELALHDTVLAGMARIVTNPRIMRSPAPMPTVVEFLDRLGSARRARWVPSGPATWEVFARLSRDDRGVTGNLVPDALLAAVALAHGCRLATADRGFARFTGLDHFDPGLAPG